MEIAGQVLVLLHLVGFAALFGGILVQLRLSAPEVNAAMLYGGWTELLTGAGLVALLVLAQSPIPYAQLGSKLAVTLFLVLLVGKNRKFESIPRGLLMLMGGLTLINAGLAVLWQ